jgi:hypothetical protein
LSTTWSGLIAYQGFSCCNIMTGMACPDFQTDGLVTALAILEWKFHRGERKRKFSLSRQTIDAL